MGSNNFHFHGKFEKGKSMTNWLSKKNFVPGSKT